VLRRKDQSSGTQGEGYKVSERPTGDEVKGFKRLFNEEVRQNGKAKGETTATRLYRERVSVNPL